MKTLVSFIAAIALLFSVSAQAGWYGSIGIMSTDYDYNDPLVEALFDNSATGYSLAGGWESGSWYAFEFEYTDFGKADRDFGGIGTGFDVEAVSLWATAHWHVGSIAGMGVDLGGRLGMTRADAEASIGPFSVSDEDTGLAAGVTARLWVTPATAVALDYRQRDLAFDIGGTSFDYDPKVVQLSLIHRF